MIRDELQELFFDLDRISMAARKGRSHPDDISELRSIEKKLSVMIQEVESCVRNCLSTQGLFVMPGSQITGITRDGMTETITVVGIKTRND